MDTIVLFDTSANLGCIIYDLVPKIFHQKIKEKLSTANDSELTIGSKVEASVANDNIALNLFSFLQKIFD